MAKKRGKGSISKKHIVSHISHNYQKKLKVYEIHRPERVIPLGMKVLLAYLSMLFFFNLIYFFLGLKTPIAFFVGQIVQGIPAMLGVIISIIVLGLVINGIYFRKKFAYYLSLAWFAIAVLDSLISLVTLSTEVAATRNMVLLSTITVIFINLLAAWYVISEKKYFFEKMFMLRKPMFVDKAFVACMIIFIVLVLLIGVFVGYDFYSQNKHYTDNLVKELQNKTSDQQMDTCNAKAGAEKDLCLIIASMKLDRPELCSEISSDFYRLTCLRAQ